MWVLTSKWNATQKHCELVMLASSKAATARQAPCGGTTHRHTHKHEAKPLTATSVVAPTQGNTTSRL